MTCRFNFSLLHLASFALAAAFFPGEASAEAYNPSTDPVAQLRLDRGEEIANSIAGFSSRDLNISDSRWGMTTFRAQVAYLPPRPPALGEGTYNADEYFGPAGAMDYSQEPFYGAFATLLSGDVLSSREKERINRRRDAYQKLRHEIESTFAGLSNASPADRRKTLLDLAVSQKKELQALVAQAEEIRQSLSWASSVYGLSASMLSQREPLLKGTVWQPLQLMEAAYYFDGLSPEQRSLLPEIAYELQAKSIDRQAEAQVEGREYFDFLPATARIRLPANLPEALKEKIRTFIGEKQNLKDELTRAVLDNKYLFTRTRKQGFITLAEQQAPRFVALETLGEEIRIGLADFGYPAGPAQADLPADLTQRVGDFQVRKAEVQRELLARFHSLQKQFPKARFEIARVDEGLAIAQTGGEAKSAAELAAFNAGLARRYTAFAEESRILRRDIQRYTESDSNKARRTVGELATDFVKAYAARENWNQYRDYARAVLEPGLSPEQRHILFQSVTAELGRAGRPPQS